MAHNRAWNITAVSAGCIAHVLLPCDAKECCSGLRLLFLWIVRILLYIHNFISVWFNYGKQRLVIYFTELCQHVSIYVSLNCIILEYLILKACGLSPWLEFLFFFFFKSFNGITTNFSTISKMVLPFYTTCVPSMDGYFYKMAEDVLWSLVPQNQPSFNSLYKNMQQNPLISMWIL